MGCQACTGSAAAGVSPQLAEATYDKSTSLLRATSLLFDVQVDKVASIVSSTDGTDTFDELGSGDNVPRTATRLSVMREVAMLDQSVPAENAEQLLMQQADDEDAEQEKGEEPPTIALIAHDNMKKLMRKFVRAHIEMLRGFKLTGTGTTCAMLREEGLSPIGSTVSGPLGGDQQIGAMIVQGEVKAVFFFRDPLSAHPHTADIEALGRLLDCYQCYSATNYRSAAALLSVMHHRKLNRTASFEGPGGKNSLAAEVQQEYLATRTAALQ